MTQHTPITRFIVELEDAVAAKLTQLIDAHLEPDRQVLDAAINDYRQQLAAWHKRSEELVRQHQGAPGTSASRIRQLFAEHAAQRPKRPVGRPRSKIRQTEIFKARNKILTELINAYVPLKPKPKKPRTKKFPDAAAQLLSA